MKDKKVVFMGTSEFSKVVLERLIEVTNVVLVVTQPDALVGRKHELKFPPVKNVAISHNIPVFQPEKIRINYEEVLNVCPDIIITCAYGQIIPKILLDYPKYGCVNVHASLLPKYRGGSPIHRCVMNGDVKTGVTIMYMDVGMDDGDIIAQREVPIDFCDNVGNVHDKLMNMSGDFLIDILPSIFDGSCIRTKQDDSLVSFAYNFKREEEKLDFNNSTFNVYNYIRGMYPYPICYVMIDGEILKICSSKIGNNDVSNYEIGEVCNVYDDGFGVKCKDGEIIITSVKPSGKKEMCAKDYINGKRKENLMGKKLC